MDRSATPEGPRVEKRPFRLRTRLAVRRPPRSQRLMLVTALGVAVPLGLFVLLATEAWQKDVSTWDARVSRALQGYQERGVIDNRLDVFDLILHPAVQVAGLLVVLSILVFMAARRRLWPALMIGVAVGGTLIFEPILKDLFERPPVDPGDSGYSFPSGHAMRSSAAAAAFTVVMWPTRWRWATTLLGAFAVGLIGIAVVVKDWHWASDVLAGWCIGIAWVAAVCLAFRSPSWPRGCSA
jgi:membrane-associated phospholipid phosphatase